MTQHRVGSAILLLVAVVTLAAPCLSPNRPTDQFRDHLYAPPMRVRLFDDAGRLHAPFVYPLRLVDRLERRYEDDRTRRLSLVWFSSGQLVQMADPTVGPLLMLGADPLGRDVLARLVLGARASLGVALAAAVAALLVGAVLGAAAGAAEGATDDALMRVADFVLVLPALYVVLALRAVTPLVLSPVAVSALMIGVLAVVGWPYVARGVRAVVLSERRQDYTLAAKAVGVGPLRLLTRYLLPASYGLLGVQATLLVPGFILAEATLSFVGLGFTDPSVSWGVMLQDASNVRAIAEFPWLLSPAAAIILVVLGINLCVRGPSGHEPLAWVLPKSR